MENQTRLDRSLKSGLNIETFEKFSRFAKTNPEAVQFEFEATGASEGRVVHTTAKTGPYTLGGQRIDRAAREYVYHIGAHKEVEEALGFTAPTDRPEPTEIVLAALTGCLNAAVSASALKRGLCLHHQEVRVRISWNPYVFLHLQNPEANGKLQDQFGKMEVELIIEGENVTQEDISYLEESMKRSAVYNLICLPHACSQVVSTSSISKNRRH
ncbi:MAG: OsmC family protein [Syntrophotaleaceae bacterium]